MSNLKIVCDSLSDIPKDLRNKYDIEMVPLTVRFDDNEYRDGIDLEPKEFYDMLREGKLPQTSQATYSQFKDVFDKFISEGKDILYISGSSRATGTYQSAIMAKNDTDGNIYTFDTMNFSYGCGMQVVKAAQMAIEGSTIEDILTKLEYMKENMYVVFCVDDLKYLQRGGRISSSKAVIGNMLGIKPILEVKDGLVTPVAQVRGKKHVFSKMVELAKMHCGQSKEIAIGHGDCELDMLKLKDIASEELIPEDILITEVGSCVGAHAGPGILGVFCVR
ncbi:DegV family protein [Paraclostridium ghonii]|uniref:DegV family protein n=1 Tax=Paraclostridium ghonii TaxID=29358 RepID=UPI00202CFBF0|nr:DegV family protein [Paeniclostridium ghonii]MCM0167038.1 DegV family protein [Paeniclostridium ghonii]